MEPAVLDVSNLHKTYGKQQVLKGANLVLDKGNILTLMGRNGVGKSTLLKIIMGLLPWEKGEIRIKGEKVFPGRTGSAKVAYLPECINLYQNLTAYENLLFFAKLQGESVTVVNPALQKAGLERQQHLLVGRLSKGQLQRLALAVVTLGNKSLLLLDEPLSGLDYQGIADMVAMLKDLKSQGTAVIVSTHYLAPFEDLSDSVLLLEGGSLNPVKG